MWGLTVRASIKQVMVHDCMVYTEFAETAAVSRGTSHVTTKQLCQYTILVDTVQNSLYEATVTHLESHATKAQ